MLHALNLNKNDLKKPQVGIGSVWFESNPCNSKLNKLSMMCKNSFNKKDIVPFQFSTVGVSDGITMGTDGMKYSLPSRELIADSIETISTAHYYDSLILIPGCDKNLPAAAMALFRTNKPGFIIYGGSMRPVKINNSFNSSESYEKYINNSEKSQIKKYDIVSSFESYGQYINNEITDKERKFIVENACDKKCGSCSGFYTANTMACLLEVMGLTLPNSSSNMSLSIPKFKECYVASDIIDNLIKKDIKPSDIITKESFNNAIKLLNIIGGSTNAVIHLLAMAKEINIDLTLDDFTHYENIPILLNVKPHGKYAMHDIYLKGGTSYLLKYLIDCDVINGNQKTITGKTLKENVSNSDLYEKNNLIYPIEAPYKKNSHIKILKGNMAPEGCVAKIYSNKDTFKATAKVFFSEEEFINALEKNQITKDDFIIIKYQGESIGCPEMLFPTSALVGYFGDNAPPLATDGRFSGGSKGILIAHLPDAYKKESLTEIIETGDTIIIDLNNNSLNIDLNQHTIEMRKNKVISTIPNIKKGYLSKYKKLVGNLSTGFSTI